MVDQNELRSQTQDPSPVRVEPEPPLGKSGEDKPSPDGRTTLIRVAGFCLVVAALAFLMDAAITFGLRRMTTSIFGVSNRILSGKVNARIVVTGSSRAASHYDPRILEALVGKSAFNLGRNGSQTDMQLAVLEAYLSNNKAPEIVLHNLDGFSFVTTREVYDLAQYLPYLGEASLYGSLQKINPEIWKSRYIPLYGYVVEDMRLTWLTGLGACFGWRPREEYFLGFNPRPAAWTDEFSSFQAKNPTGVSWPIEPEGVGHLTKILEVCKKRGTQVVLVYSPEYKGMQELTRNRSEIFRLFHKLASEHDVPLWDYSTWEHSGETAYFTNSQHLNSLGAERFSKDLAGRLKDWLAQKSEVRAGLR